ncbi:hypothetical protein B0H13DRAFT_2319742 [Mycena leptocephala]|nr:hypothetical protein B0H13DRAFT_2319742 [Mycena leptocephala]
MASAPHSEINEPTRSNRSTALSRFLPPPSPCAIAPILPLGVTRFTAVAQPSPSCRPHRRAADDGTLQHRRTRLVPLCYSHPFLSIQVLVVADKVVATIAWSRLHHPKTTKVDVDVDANGPQTTEKDPVSRDTSLSGSESGKDDQEEHTRSDSILNDEDDDENADDAGSLAVAVD